MSEPKPLIYKTYYDLAKVVLWADSPVAEDGKRASFKLGFRDGNPRFTVNTGIQGREGMITFPMDIPHFVMVMTMLVDLAEKGQPGDRVPITSEATAWENNKPTDRKEIKALLTMGITGEGIVYIGLTANEKPKIVFPFKPSKYHEVRDGNKPVDQSVVSRTMAKGIANMFTTAVGVAMVNYTNEEYTHGIRKPMPLVTPGETGFQSQTKPKSTDNFSDLDSFSL
ncbi:MAG: hypothetical protein PHN51_10255 [Candidatus Nanopelagicales bacterium]|nr:hypothetical protein [Candidatus Nanopelagicales bacterium]